MARALLLLIALAACKSSMNGDDFPVDPGGGGGVGVKVDAFMPDAPDPDASTQITGRVCLISDLRGLSCASAGAGDITVTLGTQTATTSDSGAFTIMKPAGSNLVWRASGVGVVSSVMQFGPSTTIPSIGVETYGDLLNANSVTLQAGEGSIVARVVRNTTPQAGAVGSASPAAQFPTKYDGPTAIAWTELATSAAGTLWIPGAVVGTTTVTVTPASGSAVTEDVRVDDQAITYVTIDLP